MVKDIDDLDENWLASVSYQDTYVCKNWHFYVQPFVHAT